MGFLSVGGLAAAAGSGANPGCDVGIFGTGDEGGAGFGREGNPDAGSLCDGGAAGADDSGLFLDRAIWMEGGRSDPADETISGRFFPE